MPQSNTPQSNDAIWLFSLAHMLGTDTTSTGNEWCELDMMEQTGPGAPISVNGNFVGTVHDHVYTSSNNQITNNQNTNSYQPISGLDETRWHIYGVLWTSSTITWYLDNKAVISWPTPAICQTQQMFMLLSAQVNAPQTVPVKLNVDWVRVWH
jgi:beta-glucanase (GH16 family)